MPQMKNREKPKVKKLTQAQMPPVNTAPSNEVGDRYATALFYSVQALSVIILFGGIAYTSTNMMRALSVQPIDWMMCVWMTLALTLTLLFARTLSWMGVLGAVLLAQKLTAWKSQEEICNKAQKLRKLMPSGAAWSAMVLAQSLATRGQYKEAAEVAEAEWKRNGDSDKNDQTVGQVCSIASFTYQMEGDWKNVLIWNDRTITVLGRAVENLKKPKKGIMANALSAQSGQYIGQCQMQLGSAYFANAQIYMQQNNLRQAKENFRKTIEFLTQAPDLPQKDEILKVAKEQMQRLKHS